MVTIWVIRDGVIELLASRLTRRLQRPRWISARPSAILSAMTHPVDHYSDLLIVAGWTIAEVSYADGRRLIWQVECQRREQTLIARAPTQADAWRAAWKLAGQVDG